MQNLFGVVVLHRSMVQLEGDGDTVCHGYMGILQYVKLIQCNGVA